LRRHSLKLEGTIGAAMSVVGFTLYFLGQASGFEGYLYYVWLVLVGLGSLAVWDSLQGFSIEIGRRSVIASIVAALGTSAFSRAVRGILEPQGALFLPPDTHIGLKIPPTDMEGALVYYLSISSAIITGFLYYKSFTTFGRVVKVRNLEITGILYVLGALSQPFSGSLISGIALLPAVQGFREIDEVGKFWNGPKSGVVASSIKGFGKSVWFTERGIVEVPRFFADLFYSYLWISLVFGIGLQIVFAISGDLARFSGLYPSSSTVATSIGSGIAAFATLLISKVRYRDFSQKSLENKANIIPWGEVETIKPGGFRQIKFVTKRGFFRTSLPDNKEAFAGLVASRTVKKTEL